MHEEGAKRAPKKEDCAVAPPPAVPLGLVRKGDLAGFVVGFCLDTASAIVSVYRELSFARPDLAQAVGLLKERLSTRNVEADFLKCVRLKLEAQRAGEPQPLYVFLGSKDFNLSLFVEVLCYVVSCADFLLQAGKHRREYLDVREKFQELLFECLRSAAGLDDAQITELNDTLVKRAEVYCADIPTSSHMMMAYLPPGSCADPLAFSTAAYAYVLVAAKKTFELIAISKSASAATYEFACRRCSEVVSAAGREAPFVAQCENCGTRYELTPMSAPGSGG